MPLSIASKGEFQIRALNTLSVKGLAPMFDDQSELFCNRLARTEKGLEREGLSPRYTLMTLLGLHRGEKFGLCNPFDSEAILNRLLKERRWLDNIGDLGLLLWTSALLVPGRYEEVYRDFNVAAAMGHYPDAGEGRTMEMAWFLAGLAHGALAGQKAILGLADLAGKCFEVVRKNQGRNGIFGHHAGGGGVTGGFRGRLGSFADQVYPIYAFSKFGSAFDHDGALKLAKECADTICAFQGPLGQWWWHYDSRSGRVVGKYPVYSVHQDAMAPMALFALSESSGKDYSPWVFKGLPWIYGENELKFNLCDASANIVWRCIYLSKAATYVREATSLLGFGPRSSVPGGLRVRFEDRPYHFGWELYAFANYGFNQDEILS
jgi:hypothetical protein